MHRLAATLLLVLASSALPAQRPAPVDPASCRALSATQRAWLGAEWRPYLAAVRSCAVTRATKTVLYVISVSARDYYATKPDSTMTAKLPPAWLAAPDGRSLGRLPFAFPDDPPVTLSVTFAGWTDDGMPREIRLRLDDPTAGGNRRLRALEWDAGAGVYHADPTHTEAR